MPLAGLKLKVINRERLKQFDGPVVLISNHQDNFDAFIIGGFVPKKTVSIGKKVIKYFPLFGQIYWLSGNILIDRKRKKRALGTMKQAADQMNEKGINVWVMPEGTRSRGKGLQSFKKGAFHLALQTGYPIVPVSISNYAQILQLNSFKGTPVYVKVHDPIPVTKEEIPDRDSVAALVEKSHKELKAGVDELDQMIKEEYGISS
jgi:1-acyl-sn-glycerol-3-phosphate acyltransferase